MIEKLEQEDFGKVIDSEAPAVIDFFAEWCLPCRPMEKILERLSAEYHGKVKFYRIDTDKNVELSRRLKITDIPTVIFFSESHIDIQRGTAPEDKIRAKIEALTDGERNTL